MAGGVLAAGGVSTAGRISAAGGAGLSLGGAGGMRQSAAVQGMASAPEALRRQHDPPLSLDHLAQQLPAHDHLRCPGQIRGRRVEVV